MQRCINFVSAHAVYVVIYHCYSPLYLLYIIYPVTMETIIFIGILALIRMFPW